MWVFTEIGFFSVVADRHAPDKLLVRARLAGDLAVLRDELRELRLDSPHAPDADPGPIQETPRADYYWRMRVDRALFAAWLGMRAAEISYDNFKARISASAGAPRARLYSQVWSVLRDAQEREHRSPSEIEIDGIDDEEG